MEGVVRHLDGCVRLPVRGKSRGGERESRGLGLGVQQPDFLGARGAGDLELDRGADISGQFSGPAR